MSQKEIKKITCSDCRNKHTPFLRNGLITTRKCLKCFLKHQKLKKKKARERVKLRKKKNREKKKNSISSLKKVCWKLCSEYNRRKNANEQEMVGCITCGKYQHWKKQQAGHFIPGRNNAYLFDDRGIFAQCFGCNCMKAGMWVEYEAFMIRTFGIDLVDELKALKYVTRKFTPSDLKDLIEEYKLKIKRLDEK